MMLCTILVFVLLFTQGRDPHIMQYESLRYHFFNKQNLVIGALVLSSLCVAIFHISQGSTYYNVLTYDTGFYWGYGFLLLVITLAYTLQRADATSIRKIWL
jgi:hypothetical protein